MYTGFFGYTHEAIITKVGITNSTIQAVKVIGPLIAVTDNTTISLCFASGDISIVSGSSYNNRLLGGLIGYMSNNTTLENSYASTNITYPNSESAYLAGVGGLVGALHTSTLAYSYSFGIVSGSESLIGGLVGDQISSSATNSFWDTNTSLQSSSSLGTSKTTAELKIVNSFTDNSWDFEVETSNGTNNYWDIDNSSGSYNSGYPYLAWQDGATVSIDLVSPSLVITATEVNDGGSSSDATLSLTFTADEDVTGFVVGDISVSNGALGSFTAVSSSVYTAVFTPTNSGPTTIDVASGTFTDIGLNANNAASQFNWGHIAGSTWTSSSSSDWTNASNWSAGVPNENTNVLFSGTTTATVPVGSTVTINSLNLVSGSSLTVEGTLVSTGDIILDSGASLISTGTIIGTITYNRTVTANWHLISSPLLGSTVEQFILDNGANLATGTGSNIGFSVYDNSMPSWMYYTSASTGNITSSKGYAVYRATAGTISFKGTMPSSDLAAATSLGDNGWNLIGNPYPSYIAANYNADASNNIMSSVSSFDASYAGLYVWDASTSTYIPVNNASDSRCVAPGQGFFVKTQSGISSIPITTAMQSHQTSDVFNRQSITPSVVITATKNNESRSTELRYFDICTHGLDIGFDAGTFTGSSSDFELSSHLVADSEGLNFALQALPNYDYELSIVPLNLKAAAGSEVSFSAISSNMPDNIKVYLEDVLLGTFTQLDTEEALYTINLTEDTEGVGRFYIHTNPENLKVLSRFENDFNIYTGIGKQLIIKGPLQATSVLNIYDSSGRVVFHDLLNKSEMSIQRLDYLSTGVYIVQLIVEGEIVIKRIIL